MLADKIALFVFVASLLYFFSMPNRDLYSDQLKAKWISFFTWLTSLFYLVFFSHYLSLGLALCF